MTEGDKENFVSKERIFWPNHLLLLNENSLFTFEGWLGGSEDGGLPVEGVIPHGTSAALSRRVIGDVF